MEHQILIICSEKVRKSIIKSFLDFKDYASVTIETSCGAIDITCDDIGNIDIFITHSSSTNNLFETLIVEICNYIPSWEDCVKGINREPEEFCDIGCDPAFPHRGDFERWALGM